MNYSDVKNPRYINQAHTIIECEVDFDDLPETYVLFACTATFEPDFPHTSEIFNACVNGDYGPVEPFSLPETDATAEGTLFQLRADLLNDNYKPVRNDLDAWEDMTDAKRQEWLDYKQACMNLIDDNPNAEFVWNDAIIDYELVNFTVPTIPE